MVAAHGTVCNVEEYLRTAKVKLRLSRERLADATESESEYGRKDAASAALYEIESAVDDLMCVEEWLEVSGANG